MLLEGEAFDENTRPNKCEAPGRPKASARRVEFAVIRKGRKMKLGTPDDAPAA
jgi:hypothetical protein